MTSRLGYGSRLQVARRADLEYGSSFYRHADHILVFNHAHAVPNSDVGGNIECTAYALRSVPLACMDRHAQSGLSAAHEQVAEWAACELDLVTRQTEADDTTIHALNGRLGDSLALRYGLVPIDTADQSDLDGVLRRGRGGGRRHPLEDLIQIEAAFLRKRGRREMQFEVDDVLGRGISDGLMGQSLDDLRRTKKPPQRLELGEKALRRFGIVRLDLDEAPQLVGFMRQIERFPQDDIVDRGEPQRSFEVTVQLDLGELRQPCREILYGSGQHLPDPCCSSGNNPSGAGLSPALAPLLLLHVRVHDGRPDFRSFRDSA